MRTRLALIAAAASMLAASGYAVTNAWADVTPIIMPTKPTAPEMTTGVTVKPSPHSATTLSTASFAPEVTAQQFGGELTQ